MCVPIFAIFPTRRDARRPKMARRQRTPWAAIFAIFGGALENLLPRMFGSSLKDGRTIPARAR